MTQAVHPATPAFAPDETVDATLAVTRRKPVNRWEDFGGGVPTLERNANDGWVQARPRRMSRSRQASLRALIRLICPNEVPIEGIDARVEHQVRVGMQYMPGLVAFGLSLCFALLDWSPVLMLRSVRRLRSLPEPKAAEIIHDLSESSLSLVRTTLYAIKGIILNAYFDQEEVHKALNYAPIPFMRERIAVRQRLLAGTEATPADYIPSYPLNVPSGTEGLPALTVQEI
jgi:hypothetical protein